MKKLIRWNEEKNQLLMMERNLSFEMVLDLLEREDILAIEPHPNREKYPDQKIFIVRLDSYVCYVPFVESEDEIFLKTIIPSRKLNRFYKES